MDSVQTDATTAMPWAKLVAALPSGRGRKSALEKALAPTGFTPQTFRAEAVQLEASVRESPWADVADVMDKHAVPLQDRAKNGDRGDTTTEHPWGSTHAWLRPQPRSRRAHTLRAGVSAVSARWSVLFLDTPRSPRHQHQGSSPKAAPTQRSPGRGARGQSRHAPLGLPPRHSGPPRLAGGPGTVLTRSRHVSQHTFPGQQLPTGECAPAHPRSAACSEAPAGGAIRRPQRPARRGRWSTAAHAPNPARPRWALVFSSCVRSGTRAADAHVFPNPTLLPSRLTARAQLGKAPSLPPSASRAAATQASQRRKKATTLTSPSRSSPSRAPDSLAISARRPPTTRRWTPRDPTIAPGTTACSRKISPSPVILPVRTCRSTTGSF